MKTSIEIADSLFKKVKSLAQTRKVSVRALVEEGLRLLLNQAEARPDVKPKLLTFGGDGFHDEFRQQGLSWDLLRDEIYRGHGA